MNQPRRSFLILLGMAAFIAHTSSNSFAHVEPKTILTDSDQKAESNSDKKESDKKEIEEVAELNDEEREEIRVAAYAKELEAKRLKEKQQKLKEEKAKAEFKTVETLVESDEFSKLGLTLAFDGNNAVLNGEIPQECSDRLSLDYKKSSPSEEEAKAEIKDVADISKRASKVGLRIQFKGHEKMRTLTECVVGSEQEKVAIKEKRRLVLDDREIATLTLLDSSNEIKLTDIKSAEFKKWENQLSIVNCKDCSAKKASEVDLPELQPALSKLYQADIDKLAEQIKTSEKPSEVERILKELRELNQLVDKRLKDEERDEKLLSIQELHEQLAGQAVGSCYNLKGASLEAQRKAIVKVYSQMSTLAGSDEETRESAKENAKGFDKNGSKWIQVQALTDPTGPVAKQMLADGALKEQNLQRQLMIALHTGNMARYGQIQSELTALQAQLAPVRQQQVELSRLNSTYGLNQWFNTQQPGGQANYNYHLPQSVFPNAPLFNSNNGLSTQNQAVSAINYPNHFQSGIGVQQTGSYAIPLTGNSLQPQMNAPGINGGYMIR